ncbi:hypothetical protein KPL71_007654 [Citrus sinensis]|uniref:Uncharacterized protein n=1 Tax=Citrus sinensis TaxID=2711 RepID=A0ACB8M0S8_CITSI|nr:hypothetical protein KPL71_007654 [Citrus sinensis]
MSLPKPDIEKFTIGSDFSLWKMKMRALLVHQGLESALEEDDLGDASKKTALGIWDKVEALCMKKSLAHRLFLKKRLYTFSMREGVSIQEHIDNFNKIILDLEGVENVKIIYEDKAFFLLSSLPKIYEEFVDTMLYGRTTLTLEDVKASLSSKEIQKNNRHEVSNGEGLVARTYKKTQKNEKNKSPAKKDDAYAKEKMKKRKCFYCKKQSHYIRDCDEKKNDEKERIKDAAVDSDDSSDDGYHSADLLVASNNNIKGHWVLDSGCSFHLCHDKSLFHTYESVDGGRVLMGNNNVCKIVGMGSVKIDMFDRTVKTLCDVRHAPRLKRNLISLAILDSMEYYFKYENVALKIMKGTKMIMKGLKKNGMYVLEGSSVPVSATMPAVSDGPAQVPSLSGGRYFMSVIDDYSRKVWIYILKTEDQRPSLGKVQDLENFGGNSIWFQEAVATASYLVNKSPSAAIGFKTPKELWSGKPGRDVQFNEVAMINNPDQATSATDISTNKTQATEAIDQSEKIEPNSYIEAMNSKNSRNWIKAIREERDSLVKNQTWTLVPNLGNRKIVSCKWIFKKNDILGVEDSRYKARLMARGFTQKEGIDFNEIFSPVVKHSSIRTMLAMVALFDLELEQIDVKTAFLHGNLEEKILMSQPEGFEENGYEDYVSSTKVPIWSKYDSCVYHEIINSGGALYLLLYIDDILIAGKNISHIKKLKNLLNGEFKMKDLGSVKRILGIDIVRDRAAGTLFLSQSRYISKVLERFQMMDSKPVLTLLGAQFKLSDDMSSASDAEELYWDAVKWVMRYLKGTLDHGLMYGKSKHEVCEVREYVDSDFARDLDRRKSIYGYLCMLDNYLISWKATLQHIVALSSTEAEFVAATEAVKESMWLKGLLNELWLKQRTMQIFCDNQSVIQLIKNQVYHERTKHIDVKFHFIKDEVAKGSVAVIKIHTNINPTDMLTKVLPTAKFKFCVDLIGVGSSSSS